jgi:hypothetical protein
LRFQRDVDGAEVGCGARGDQSRITPLHAQRAAAALAVPFERRCGEREVAAGHDCRSTWQRARQDCCRELDHYVAQLAAPVAISIVPRGVAPATEPA